MKTLHKLDIKGTREGEEEVPTHTYEQVVESKEPTLHKLDQVWPGTREGKVAVRGRGAAGHRAPTNIYHAETKRGDFHQYEDDRSVSTTARLRKAGEEDSNERHPQHKVKTKGKEEATMIVNGYKRPVLRDKEGR